jgi:phosphate transport system protein
MQKHFEKEFEILKTHITQMSHLVDRQVELSITSMETGDIDLCQKVKHRDKEVDAYDNLIQSECENILALFQPVAYDLRYIIACILINNNLERCGDIAANITKRVKKTINYHDLLTVFPILDMAREARMMVKNAIDAFISENSEMARKVLETDNVVDDFNKTIFRQLIAKMQESKEMVEPCAHLLVLTRNIERLADHATNIAEEVIFTVEAKIVSHSKIIKDKTA